MNYLLKWLTGEKYVTNVEGNTFTQRFNIFIVHNRNGSTLMDDFQFGQEKTEAYKYCFLLLVSLPRGGLYCCSSMHFPPPTHENVGNVKWGLTAMAFGASATVIDLP